eukprot:gnl/TRDRNA2_/TRDRNA2_131796_c0_seq1.p2 gnl/TRDRNA2_/TRDRNA2_131796_c0~~gnl/TRDRNA2_/TRDRNA2_131796_c0_seq1.p2  ORF type:complete len:126 (+),score=38.44 gnl/TRDRNA2_/TRDRNA2_131796_c0_seq1:58-435(+)
MAFRTFAVIAAALLAAPAAAGTCGPQTKVLYSDAMDAASNPIYTDAGATEGVCKDMQGKKITHAKLCGPGKFTLSRMSCNHHEHAAVIKEHSKTEYTTQCEEYDLTSSSVGINGGYLGSVSFECP